MATAITLEQVEILMFLDEGIDNEPYDMIIRSISIQGITDAFRDDPDRTTYSENVIRRHVDGLLKLGYVGLGVKLGNTFTHYITASGKQFLAEATSRPKSGRRK